MSTQRVPSREELDLGLGKSSTLGLLQPPQTMTSSLAIRSHISLEQGCAEVLFVAPVLSMTPGGTQSPSCTAPAPARQVLCQGTPSGVVTGQPQLLFFGLQSFGATVPWREGKYPDFLLRFFLGCRWCFICFPVKKVEEEHLTISFALRSI